MSYEAQPIDHFSNEAQTVYTQHLSARIALASIGAKVAVTGERIPVEAAGSAFIKAAQSTTMMYIDAYRKQGQFDRDIANKLLPRIGDEHRLYAAEELKQAKELPGFSPELQQYLDYRYNIDRAAVDAQIDQSSNQPLEKALSETTYRLGAVIVAHIGDCMR